ncbi:MAG: hypothetical protein M3N13_09790 [Candidatus Eremiobacteraeota bacterium]|nr:hypothetical protein [Candidatus Eremiobacteraeota bacterium]
MRLDPTIAALYAEMDDYVTDYPARAVTRAAAFARGTAFFPLGSGRFEAGSPLPNRSIAIVAHIFDEASYRYALGPGAGHERIHGNRTWVGLRRVFDLAGVDIRDCFLTNALVGIKAGPATGAVRAGPRYRAECAAFLARQLALVRPRLVVTLGTHALAVLREAVPALDAFCGGARSIGALDARLGAGHIARDIAIGRETLADVAVLRHPCAWTNLPRVGCAGRGHAADADVLRRALVTCATEGDGTVR